MCDQSIDYATCPQISPLSTPYRIIKDRVCHDLVALFIFSYNKDNDTSFPLKIL